MADADKLEPQPFIPPAARAMIDAEFAKAEAADERVRTLVENESVTVTIPLAEMDPAAAELLFGPTNGPVAAAEVLYARGRRDTPTGTVIARLDPIADRAAWLEVRRTGIGSSDVPALLGLSRGMYAKSELDLYMDKIGAATDQGSGEAALWGNIFEDPVAREWARRESLARDTAITVQRVGTIAHVDHRHMLCDLDRRVIGCPDHQRCALEVKTRSAFKADEWADGVPDDTEAQVMHQLAVTGYDAIHVAAVIGGQRLVSYVVTPDADMIEDLVAIEHEFWHENVLAEKVPTISNLELLVEHLKHYQPVKGEPVDVAGAEALEVLHDTLIVDEFKGKHRPEAEAAEARLKARFGEDTTDLFVVDSEGERRALWTWRPQNAPKRLDTAALEADLPPGRTVADYKVPNGTTRVLRRVKPKEKP